jgi:hypothetical protein
MCGSEKEPVAQRSQHYCFTVNKFSQIPKKKSDCRNVLPQTLVKLVFPQRSQPVSFLFNFKKGKIFTFIFYR